jgi:hypothetical protein
MSPATHAPTEWDCFYCGREFLAAWGQLFCDANCRAAWYAAHPEEKKLAAEPEPEPPPLRIRRLTDES